MYFLVDNVNKIIFGWSAKCGCSHIKHIYWFLQTNNLDNVIHTKKDYNEIPNDITNYTTLIFSRNPYKRIVSGFLEKYKKNGEYRNLWPYPSLTFSQFIDKLIDYNWDIIDKHHFEPQTEYILDKKILMSKTIKFYDISNINYAYIEQLYKKNIPDYVINKKEGHERQYQITTDKYLNDYVYDLNIDEYINYNIDIKYFYNEEIIKKVFNFYIEDFNFFEENGINYKKITLF
jgi:hypothetical protein